MKISFGRLVITTSATVPVPAKEINGIPIPDLMCASFFTILSSTESSVEFNGREWVLLRSVMYYKMYRTPDQKCNITVEVPVHLWSLTVVMGILTQKITYLFSTVFNLKK